jgi:plasmid maintenance system antidote protein VapI
MVFIKTSAEFWMNLQVTYDLRNAEKRAASEGDEKHRRQ